MNRLYDDVLLEIFLLLDRYTHTQCCLVCKDWWAIIKSINNWQERNWRHFDRLATHYQNEVIPRVLALNLPQLSIHKYYEMIINPDKYGTPKLCIEALISRSPATRATTMQMGISKSSLCQLFVKYAFDMHHYPSKKEIIPRVFNQIIIPYVCSGQFTYVSGVRDLYPHLRGALTGGIYFCEIIEINTDWLIHHYLNVIDLFVWVYNRDPNRFKNEFIVGNKFVMPLARLYEHDLYIFNSFSEEIQEIILDGIKNRDTEKLYLEIKSTELHRDWLKRYPRLRSWILENFSEWIFYLMRDKRKKLFKIFLKFEQRSLQKIRNYKGQTLYQYALSLKYGSSRIIDKLKDLNPPRKGSKITKKNKRIKERELLYNSVGYWKS